MERVLVRGHHRSGTTVLGDILRHYPDIYVTYETGMYSTPFFNMPNGKKINGFLNVLTKVFHSHNSGLRHDILNMKLSIEEKVNVYSSPVEIIKSIENEVFQGRFRIIGDKFPTVPEIESVRALIKEPEPLKIIWIYRDGRDVVSSCYRHGGQGKMPQPGDTRPMWSCVTVEEGARRWASVLQSWEGIKEEFGECVPILEVKYEELLRFPNMVCGEIGEFLGINPEPLYKNYQEKFHHDFSHTGQWQEIIPNWKKEFTPEALNFMDKLGYV